MEDISGKKFSLQDWVMKRAANQSGVVVPPLSVRQSLSEQEAELEEKLAEAPAEIPNTIPVEVEMKSVSNGSAMKASSVSREEPKEDVQKTSKEKETPLSSFAHSNNPLQQLQIVRLLTDLGDRLRQSEKEREVLWKEVEICRKQIADMGGRENKSEKSYSNLETQINQREVFVKELVEKQIGLEQKLKDQAEAFETSKKEQGKLVEKLTSVETATGSAIVRVEDIVAENAKLSKKVEQLGQDKVRLTRKLEIVEETLTQTQDILKAKALVLLTDHAVAAKTALPQTPAWTGDDTLKVSESAAAVVSGAVKKEAAGPVSDITASLRPKTSFKIQPSTVILAALVVLGIVGGIVGSQYFKSANMIEATPLENVEPAKDENLEPQAEGNAKDTSAVDAPQSQSDEEMMAKAAKIVSQIEPGNEDATTDIEQLNSVAVATGVLPKEFESAQIAQDKAVADFNEAAPSAPLTERIKSDKNLPRGIVGIENKAFAGDGNAQHDLAAIYTAGHAGVKVNYTKASQWFESAAYNGVPNAQYNLGVLYHQGLGVKKDTAKAMELYRVAASNNHPEAEYNLAIAYVEGVGAEYNPQIAAVYFEQSAGSGVVEAAYNLGLLHENGLLGESQPDEAIFWYTLAANKGNQDAIKALDQLKTQLSMSDEDADRVARKIAAQRPLFADNDGNPAMPEAKSVVESASANVPLSITSDKDAPIDTVVKSVAQPVAKVVAKTAKADPVIISQIQEQLIRLGLYKGQPNGTESAVLSQAIKTYQQKNGMKVDGNASDDLLVKMLASTTESKASGLNQ